MTPSIAIYAPMTPITSATVLADSVSPLGIRLSTMELVYPRFIHAEVMTHRVFSRNASSSRAIPFDRMVAMIRARPAVPASWRMNERGMQGYTVANEAITQQAEGIWMMALEDAIRHAAALNEIGIHKQTVNRITEPFQHIKTVMTGVYWDNWTGLRDHHAADPTIEPLAKAITAARAASTPMSMVNGDWHLPYVSPEEIEEYGYELCKKVSAARCARTSYNSNVDGKRSTLVADVKLHDALLIDQPIHASPAEHQATPDYQDAWGQWQNKNRWGNLAGWQQYRKFLANENLDTLVR